ncbi:MAG: hypothetical protein PHU51_01985 [Candidatus Nanoarchaeia archaeon]|nr:hypothetical protein [Candidatus Nanoarchaeia archaeon]
MINEKNIKESKERIIKLINNKEITTKNTPKYVDFFINNANNSVDTAKILYELSTNKDKQNELGLTSFNGLLWVINSSYYSMFYMARALLENQGIKINGEMSIHLVTFDAIIYFFYLTKKLEKNLIEDLINAQEEASESLGKQKADEIIQDYLSEKIKRGRLTYEMGEIILESKAMTSLKRAQKFNLEIKKMILK